MPTGHSSGGWGGGLKGYKSGVVGWKERGKGGGGGSKHKISTSSPLPHGPGYDEFLFIERTVSRDFTPCFFFWFQPSWAPYSCAKVFSNIVLNSHVQKSPRYHGHRYRWLKLGGINDTAELSSAMELTPQSETKRCHWHSEVKTFMHFAALFFKFQNR